MTHTQKKSQDEFEKSTQSSADLQSGSTSCVSVLGKISLSSSWLTGGVGDCLARKTRRRLFGRTRSQTKMTFAANLLHQDKPNKKVDRVDVGSRPVVALGGPRARLASRKVVDFFKRATDDDVHDDVVVGGNDENKTEDDDDDDDDGDEHEHEILLSGDSSKSGDGRKRRRAAVTDATVEAAVQRAVTAARDEWRSEQAAVGPLLLSLLRSRLSLKRVCS